MSVLSVRFDEDEEKIILTRMALAGETNKSAHVRRIYFSAENGNERLIGSLKKQIDELQETVEHSQKLIRHLTSASSDDIEIKLLAGLYMLLYPSVDRETQAAVDKYLDIGTIENYLKAIKRRATK